MIYARLKNSISAPRPCWYVLDDDGDDDSGRPIERKYYMCPECLAVFNTRLYPDSCDKCGQPFNGCELH